MVDSRSNSCLFLKMGFWLIGVGTYFLFLKRRRRSGSLSPGVTYSQWYGPHMQSLVSRWQIWRQLFSSDVVIAASPNNNPLKNQQKNIWCIIYFKIMRLMKLNYHYFMSIMSTTEMKVFFFTHNSKLYSIFNLKMHFAIFNSIWKSENQAYISKSNFWIEVKSIVF